MNIVSIVLRSCFCFMWGMGVFSGCEPMAPANQPDNAAELPAWEGRMLELFDNNMDPAALGLSIDSSGMKVERVLQGRAASADVVARVRVNTVTVDSLGANVSYHIQVQVGRPTFAPAKLKDDSFELVIASSSPAFGLVKAYDTRLQGMTFIGFFKMFRDEYGEPTLKWHLSADNADVAKAVNDAIAIGEFRKH